MSDRSHFIDHFFILPQANNKYCVQFKIGVISTPTLTYLTFFRFVCFIQIKILSCNKDHITYSHSKYFGLTLNNMSKVEKCIAKKNKP